MLVEHTINNVMQIVICADEINNLFSFVIYRKKKLLLIAYKTKSFVGSLQVLISLSRLLFKVCMAIIVHDSTTQEILP